MRTHGTNSSYTTGCRCQPCRDAHNAYCRRLRMGQRALIGAEGYTKRIRALTLPEMTLTDLSRRTGVPVGTLRGLRDGTITRTHAETAAKLEPWLGGV